jgi:hypothetical protein
VVVYTTHQIFSVFFKSPTDVVLAKSEFGLHMISRNALAQVQIGRNNEPHLLRWAIGPHPQETSKGRCHISSSWLVQSSRSHSGLWNLSGVGDLENRVALRGLTWKDHYTVRAFDCKYLSHPGPSKGAELVSQLLQYLEW